jgi:hypothetical protein
MSGLNRPASRISSNPARIGNEDDVFRPFLAEVWHGYLSRLDMTKYRSLIEQDIVDEREL